MHLNLTQRPTLELTVDEALSLQSQLSGLIQDVLRGYTREAIASTAVVTNHEERVVPSIITFHLSK